MDFQVVVLAGGTSNNLIPLVSKDVPKLLLPVANRPVLSYVLEQLEQSNLKDLIVMEIRADLMDAHLYAFKRSVLQEVLNQKQTFRSLKQDVLPYLVKSQLRSEILLNGAQAEENGNEKDAFSNNKVIGEASHISGCSFSVHNNVIHPSAVLGSKITVGPQCMLGEGSQMGDKCSVK